MPSDTNELQAIASFMRELVADPKAQIGYDLFADALVWSDEWPQFSVEDLAQVNPQCLRAIFRYRTSMILGAPVQVFQSSWEEGLRLFPDWPGFDPHRREHELKEEYEKRRRAALAKWDDLESRTAATIAAPR